MLFCSEELDEPDEENRIFDLDLQQIYGDRALADEGEEGEPAPSLLPRGDEEQGWHPVYGVAMLLGLVTTLSWLSFRIYVAARRSDAACATQLGGDELSTAYRRRE